MPFHNTLFVSLVSTILLGYTNIWYNIDIRGLRCENDNSPDFPSEVSENSANTVIVLEAGASGFDNPNIANLSGPSIQALPLTSVDWNYTSIPQKYAANQTIQMTRGHVLGGSSAVNGAVFVRPNAIDIDLWETAFGATGWNWQTVSASIKKAEHFSATDNVTSYLSFHGTSGPICDSQRTPGVIWSEGVIPSVLASGGQTSIDQNGGNPSGIWYTPKAMFPNSTRSYSANSYYLPNAGRSNLEVILDVTVSRILWGKSKNGKAVATGVEYINTITGKTSTVSGDRIILSAGVFGTPQVLELSGVGNPKIMNPLGISTVVNLPAVGENLAEQPTTKYVATLASGYTNAGLQLTLNYESPRTLLTPLEWLEAWELLQVAPPNLSAASHAALIAMYLADSVIVEFMGFPNPADLIFLPILLHPMSRGSSHIVSANATHAPSFDLALLESPFDVYILKKAAIRARRFASQSYMKPFLAGEVSPGTAVQTDAQFEAFVKSAVGVAYHPLGTASFGSVVDSTLRVMGTTNVFVVDGSIIPTEPGSHPSSIIYGIGEQAATMLNARPLSSDV
ncbi:L-sorbose 1-dehydrogenase [Mycena sanguinolenta]|uniref:L-sorbose 1-dehydrogenase n=1 Tax=Mycena sanguinolenta TaxID=230812 RepID=A0A8H6XNL2_9AGAR|nr:L-sorbose 1-dehydrogenase [Mycena sanguinolenta]